MPSAPLRRLFRRFALPAALALAAAPATALALDLATVLPARDETGRLWVTVRLESPLEDRIEQSLGRGMPATFQLHAELWRRRSGWFDRMELASDATMRLRHDGWDETWRIERAGQNPLSFGSLDSLESALMRPIALPLGMLDRVAPDAGCYIVLSATVKPLNVEDAAEVEGWLSGEAQEQRRAGFGVFTQLPRSIFDAVRNFAGFGDAHARAITPVFLPSTLPIIRR